MPNLNIGEKVILRDIQNIVVEILRTSRDSESTDDDGMPISTFDNTEFEGVVVKVLNGNEFIIGQTVYFTEDDVLRNYKPINLKGKTLKSKIKERNEKIKGDK